MRVLVPLADGVEEIEAVTVIDVLRRGGVDVTSAALGIDATVTGSRGIKLIADELWATLDIDAFDAIVLPGGGKGTENLCDDLRVIEAVQAFDAAGKYVAALCAAPTVLAAAGLLNNRKATCYPTVADQLGDAYDAAAPVIADGNMITSQGPGTAMLFALVLVKHFGGDEAAQRVADALLTQF